MKPHPFDQALRQVNAGAAAVASISASVRYMTDGEASPWLLVAATALLVYAFWHVNRE